nr:copper transporter [Petropleomorpha daqingensis]
MEQLRVLAGEPLLVIDFRYHLVSLIAVFLAIALGIVIGTTQLNGKVLDDLRGQVSSLEQDKRDLEDNTQQLQGQQDEADAFETAVAPALVDGSLNGRSVVLVVTDDQVSSDTVDEVTALIGQAGGTVSGTIRLAPAYSDPAKTSALENYVTGGGLPTSVTLPAGGDAGQLAASVLAQVLMTKVTDPPPSTADLSSVLAGLTSLKVLSADSASVTPANFAVVLTAGAFKGDDADQRNSALAELAAALDAAGEGAVVSGDAASAADQGLVGVLRNDPTTSAAVSTVDNVDSIAGQISTVLALGSEGDGTSGKYGTGQDTQPVPPVPAKTP